MDNIVNKMHTIVKLRTKVSVYDLTIKQELRPLGLSQTGALYFHPHTEQCNALSDIVDNHIRDFLHAGRRTLKREYH